MKTYVVEPQQIFVPSLLDLLQESGCSVVRVQSALEPLDIVRARPQMLFFDADASDDTALRGVQFLLDSMPELDLCIYSRTPLRELRPRSSTRLLQIEKSAPHDALLDALGRFTAN